MRRAGIFFDHRRESNESTICFIVAPTTMASKGYILVADLPRNTDVNEQPRWSQRMRANYDVRSGEIQSMQQAGVRLCTRLQRHARNLGPNLAVLKRLIVRNSSQHRRGVSFQLLRRTSRLVHRYVDFNMRDVMQQFLDGLPHISAMGASISGKELPSYAIFGRVLQAILGAVALAQVAVDHSMMTFRACSGDLANALFMPLNLTCVAVVSRISAEIQAQQSLLISAYKTIYICTTWSNFGGFNEKPLNVNEGKTASKSKRRRQQAVEACPYPARIEEWVQEHVASRTSSGQSDEDGCAAEQRLSKPQRPSSDLRAMSERGLEPSSSLVVSPTEYTTDTAVITGGLLHTGSMVHSASQGISRLEFALDYRHLQRSPSNSARAGGLPNSIGETAMYTELALAAAATSSDEDDQAESADNRIAEIENADNSIAEIESADNSIAAVDSVTVATSVQDMCMEDNRCSTSSDVLTRNIISRDAPSGNADVDESVVAVDRGRSMREETRQIPRPAPTSKAKKRALPLQRGRIRDSGDTHRPKRVKQHVSSGLAPPKTERMTVKNEIDDIFGDM